MSVPELIWRVEWLVVGYLRAHSAVGNASGREIGGLEDSLSAGHGGGGDGKDGGGELHLDGCWGFGGLEDSVGGVVECSVW